MNTEKGASITDRYEFCSTELSPAGIARLRRLFIGVAIMVLSCASIDGYILVQISEPESAVSILERSLCATAVVALLLAMFAFVRAAMTAPRSFACDWWAGVMSVVATVAHIAQGTMQSAKEVPPDIGGLQALLAGLFLLLLVIEVGIIGTHSLMIPVRKSV